MQEIRVGTFGTILNGKEAGWLVFIEDDSQQSGGYLILVTPPKHTTGLSGYDNWVEDFVALQSYFKEAGWDVQWPANRTGAEGSPRH